MFLRMFFFHLFFRMSSHCWLCPGTFGNRRELRLHVASAPHFRLRVVCPWCVGIERTSNRMADFKKHVNVKHSGVGVSNDFFSEASGFYLALYPTDYARVINPIPMTSPTAQTAIHAVRLWLRGPTHPDQLARGRPVGIWVVQHHCGRKLRPSQPLKCQLLQSNRTVQHIHR